MPGSTPGGPSPIAELTMSRLVFGRSANGGPRALGAPPAEPILKQAPEGVSSLGRAKIIHAMTARAPPAPIRTLLRRSPQSRGSGSSLSKSQSLIAPLVYTSREEFRKGREVL